jgi:ABC-type arginine transport system permease subunit
MTPDAWIAATVFFALLSLCLALTLAIFIASLRLAREEIAALERDLRHQRGLSSPAWSPPQ